MRLLIALPDVDMALAVQASLPFWEVSLARSGHEAIALLEMEPFDLLLMHLCLPGVDGLTVGARLPFLAPKVLFVCPMESCPVRPAWADAMVAAGASAERLCSLLQILAQKPLPRTAAAHQPSIAQAVEHFLDSIALQPRYKGRDYIAYMLCLIIPTTRVEPLGLLYQRCAAQFGTTPASVERCVRVAVESVFTRGSIRGIEHFFGATVDPERGKPTNRAFLMEAAQQLRYSLADTRSPKSNVMHHSPAAPTSV